MGGCCRCRQGKELLQHVNHDLISSIPLFQHCRDPGFISLLCGAMDMRLFSPGDMVIEEGTQGSEMYFIHKGSVEVLKRTPSGEEARLATLSAGEYFGENALLSGADVPRNATVRCASARCKVRAFVIAC